MESMDLRGQLYLGQSFPFDEREPTAMGHEVDEILECQAALGSPRRQQALTDKELQHDLLNQVLHVLARGAWRAAAQESRHLALDDGQ